MNINLSIIIPYHEDISKLHRLLQSIGRSSGDIEVIVINDHGDEINSSFSCYDFNVKYIYNNGVSRWAGASRNIGIKESKGKYLIFADSDDVFIKDAIYRVNLMLLNSDDDVDVFYMKPTSKNENGSPSSRHIPYEKLVNRYLIDKNEALRYKFHVPWSKVIKRKYLLDNHIFFDEIIASNDVMFSLKVGYYAKNIQILNEVMYCVVENKTSLTKNKSSAVWLSRFKVWCSYNDFIKSSPEYREDVGYCLYMLFKSDRYLFFKCLFYALNNRQPLGFTLKNILKILKVR